VSFAGRKAAGTGVGTDEGGFCVGAVSYVRSPRVRARRRARLSRRCAQAFMRSLKEQPEQSYGGLVQSIRCVRRRHPCPQWTRVEQNAGANGGAGGS
jgi:hypothetical protein